ncbi:aldo/keto reductase [Allosaccharopolyspora coralli]|uniref:Aldo/keto reductase n=1 Tax=Allosaccharopolyspora coralli TaxID=2665642 RepID=A0A5Q3QAK0_9PSEU|nr:aldo/keto reductase [Allosaccharopolyspora coralli]QGK68639.1 aldo/keto reductase [Allosaccharopolyspora coralli]
MLDSYVTLGRSGLRVSPLCLGTMTFGQDWGWGADEHESRAVLSRYLERGGNFVDTANIYTNGHSEKIIGDHFADHPGLRDRVVLATKFFANLYPGDPNGGGTGRKAVMSAVEESLRRLRTDHIDLYWMHAWDQDTPIEETMRALDDLVGAGKVRYVGFSDTPAWKTAQAHTLAQSRGWTPLTALQVEYSLLERTVEGELLPMAEDLGLGVTPWSPLRGGLLSGKYTRENAGTAQSDRGPNLTGQLSEQDYALIDQLRAIADGHGVSVAAVALAWVQQRCRVHSTIIGARRLDQLEANLSALEIELSTDEMSTLDKLSQPRLDFPADFLQHTPHIAHAGATVNGQETRTPANLPASDADRY